MLGAVLLIGSPLALATVTPLATEGAPVVVSVNGTPIDADAGQKVEGCAVVVEVTGLDPDAPPVSVGITISAVAPTVAEGSTSVLVEDVRSTEQGRLTAEYDMAPLVEAAGFELKTNGHRLAVAVTLDDTSVGSRELWLACGAPQDGEPHRIVFEVRWLDVAGQPLAVPLDGTMPSGWRDAYVVRASSSRGTATCTVLPGAEQLECDYDNPGHGSGPGLVVPGGKRHTYEVAQDGLPAGWQLDESTVGTFLGRETCPTDGCDGGDHDDGGGSHAGGSCGGHEEEVAASEATAAEDGATCLHTVVNQQRAPTAPTPVPDPTTSTTTTTSTTSTTTTSTTSTTVATTTTSAPPTTTTTTAGSVLPSEETATPGPSGPATVGAVALPRTGSGLAGLALVGLALIVSGLVLRVAERTGSTKPPG
ncbi:hypothetical protein NHL50_02880 [Acidimicrobiia bacterium EGI L10123]|uniref:hypothetical protein n=1 Tax=Salinilacustrithrix flava TaxID=2957203 RepID=UPI003D7C2ABA|nr:hypothetical protein [Acidimicrobiia bacterium EGI L10123]